MGGGEDLCPPYFPLQSWPCPSTQRGLRSSPHLQGNGEHRDPQLKGGELGLGKNKLDWGAWIPVLPLY